MATRQSRVPEVYEPHAVRPVGSGREEPAAGLGDDGEGCNECKGYEWQVRSQGVADPLRNSRTRIFAAVTQSGDVTSNQTSRALRRSQVS